LTKLVEKGVFDSVRGRPYIMYQKGEKVSNFVTGHVLERGK